MNKTISDVLTSAEIKKAAVEVTLTLGVFQIVALRFSRHCKRDIMNIKQSEMMLYALKGHCQ